jgi:hypothetical protein
MKNDSAGTTIDISIAVECLLKAHQQALQEGYQAKSRLAQEIQEIILGEHLTFRYLLVTALLAKASNERINALALQSGASLDGAYDARSLCHKVIVPFERQHWGSRLGGSNEPFLNKPARFPSISKNNAVRKGRDLAYLIKLHDILASVAAEEAFDMLVDAIFSIFKRPSGELRGVQVALASQGGDRIRLLAFIEDILTESHQGESCVFIVGALLEMVLQSYGEDFSIRVHPVNQSGASSREISDVDVYDGAVLFLTVEVKDKIFFPSDLEHAVNKARQASLSHLLFLKGKNAILSGEAEEAQVSQWLKEGFDLLILPLPFWASSLISIASKGFLERFLGGLERWMKVARAKDSTKAHFARCAERYGWAGIFDER